MDRNESASNTMQRWKYKMEIEMKSKQHIENSDSLESLKKLKYDMNNGDEIEWNVGCIIKIHHNFTNYLSQKWHNNMGTIS